MTSVLITGGRKGLGRALALESARRGWKTFAFSRSLETRLDKGVYWLKGDVTDAESLEAVRNFVARETSSLDVLVNNAGAGGRGADLESVSPNEIIRQIRVHCVGALQVTQVFKELLVAASRPVVVNVTSRFGSTSQLAAGRLNGSEISYGYRIAKAAQNMLTQCLAHDPSITQLSVLAINPGQLLTDSAARDAERTPEKAARAIVDLLVRGEFQRGEISHAFGEDAFW
jgi:NAD(P)-dependent dehydrogenase (short-subunit alcohol dehydrogenase family)